MLPKVRAVCRIQECAAEFEVDNFPVACLVASASQYDDQFREACSGPVMSVGGFRFAICLTWGVDRDKQSGRKSLCKGKHIGAYVRRCDRSKDSAMVKMEMQILNRDEGKSRTLSDSNHVEHRAGDSRGWSPSFGARHGIDGLMLSKILDPAQGWLHDGALRAVCKLSVVLDFSTEDSPPAAASSERELSDSFQAILDSGLLADVTIRVGDQSIQAHSAILAARSPVFAAMLSSGMRESQGKEVVLSDLDAPAVRGLLSFLYTGVVKDETLESDESTLALLQAAHRYEATSLVEKCVEALRARLQVETVAERLEVADLIGCATLKAKCLDFMREHIAEVQETSSYAQLTDRRPLLLKDVIKAMVGPLQKKRRTADTTARAG